MNILAKITRKIAENVASTGEYPEHVRAEAQRLIRETSMSTAQAYVVAGDNHGLDDDIIDREIVWSGKNIDRVRWELREKSLDAAEDIAETQKTRNAIDDWAESPQTR